MQRKIIYYKTQYPNTSMTSQFAVVPQPIAISSSPKWSVLSLLLQICLIISLATPTQQFYLQLLAQHPKCFLKPSSPHVGINIDIKLPTITDKIEIQLELYVRNNKFYSQEVQMQKKITIYIPKSNDNKEIQELKTCLRINIKQENQNKKQDINKNRYLVWFSQEINFVKKVAKSTTQSHISQAQKKDNELYLGYYLQGISSVLSKINSTYQQQLDIYEVNQERETKNDKQLYEILQYSYLISAIQSGVILATIFLYVWTLYQYL